MEKSRPKKKTRQTRQSSKENKDEKIEPEIDGTNIGEHITYDVLRMILEYSNIRDLTRAAMVCRSWNEAAKKEILIRIRPQNILNHLRPNKEKDQVRQTFTDQLLIRPNIGLLFMGKQERTRRCERWNNDDCLCRRVPHQTNCITVWNFGLVHNDSELEGDVVSGLFLPKIPGVKIKCFAISKSEAEQFRTTTHRRSREKLARKFLKISPKEDNIKSIILFANEGTDGSDDSRQSDAKQILRTLISQQTNNKDKISVWGGFGSKLTVCTPVSNGDPCDHIASLAGISICGAGVSTWSIVLDRRITTKGQLEKELTTFRDAVKLQKHSVGFMFACCGRGEDWYGEKDVEPKVFRKFFPHVPLVGSFGGGEFGLTTISQECSRSPGIVYEYSTIFLILTYDSMRKI